MSLIPFIGGQGSGDPGGDPPTGVQLKGNDFLSRGSGTIYSGVQFHSNGGCYERQPAGGWSRIFTWLLSGTNSDFYIVRSIVSGGLTTDDGAGPLVLSTTREYDIQSASDTDTTVSFEIQIADTTVKASRTYTFEVIGGIQ